MARANNIIAVAIDGPSGAGKSTVAKELAAATGFIYVDTGAMYRAVAFYNILRDVNLKDQAAVERNLADIYIDIRYDSQNKQRIILNDQDVTEDLRTQQAAEGASLVAAYQAVREKLVTLQQELARKYSVVMDGRDIGTFVLPDARTKIYLDASVEERTRRRMHELQQKGEPAEYEEVRQAIEVRDHRDMNRVHSPLIRANDAFYIQSDGMTVQDITEKILTIMAKAR